MFSDLTVLSAAGLIFALALALSFEFVNGFHDTANAVATVIYTHSLRPTQAVVWSGFWNFLGVLTSTGTVAFGIVALLPVDLILNIGSAAGFAMVFSLLASAILWNLGTWYFGLPASSSHTLIGSILGVGLANAALAAGSRFGDGVNWDQAREATLSMVVSPLIGFCAAGLLLLATKLLVRRPELFAAPEPAVKPPLWIRGILVLTCTGVSFAHGSNDGQKGMGIVLLILIGILPATYAINPGLDQQSIDRTIAQSKAVEARFIARAGGASITEEAAVAELSRFLKTHDTGGAKVYASLAQLSREVRTDLEGHHSLADIDPALRARLRRHIFLLSESISHFHRLKLFDGPAEHDLLLGFRSSLDDAVRYIPVWVKLAVALALGCGTMIGWKRIVVTVGEKIGKSHLSYAQGASAELVAAFTIAAADIGGWPVSTTHVLSSGVAGTMAANRSGLQAQTLRNMLMAWVLTLPVCLFLGAMLFALGLNIIAKFGLR